MNKLFESDFSHSSLHSNSEDLDKHLIKKKRKLPWFIPTSYFRFYLNAE